jgi:beta-lactamase class A
MNKVLIILLGISVAANAVLFIYLKANRGDIKVTESFEVEQQKYPLLSKRVLQEFPQDILINFLDLRRELRSEVSKYDGASFGVYFEYLPTGSSIGVNDREEFHAASLFKLPTVMAYYHWKERTGSREDPVLTIEEKHINNEFGNLWKEGIGHKIKLSEAVKLALQESDNTAAQLIIDYVTREDFEAVYEGLDIELELDSKGAILTAKNYSSILKSLYFASVLSKDSSEEILDYLTKTKFPDKLAAGVPGDVMVAHKIGNFNDEDGEEAYTDCGIVYIPRRPYLLCMLSRSDEETARERMQHISELVYDYVSGYKNSH